MLCAYTKDHKLTLTASIAGRSIVKCECVLETRYRRQLESRKTNFTIAFVCDDKKSERLFMKHKFAATSNKIDFYDNAFAS